MEKGVKVWKNDDDEAKGQIVKIESEQSSCCSRILTEINGNYTFQLFFIFLNSRFDKIA